MRIRRTSNHLALLLVAGIASFLIAARGGLAQVTLPPATAAAAAKASAGASTEILLRGPVHEAFAARYQGQVKAGAMVKTKPPAALREIPPALRPAGDDVHWIPGYWSWDDGQRDYLWISGAWRKAPMGCRWMPGYWSEADGGYRWTAGAWMGADTDSVAYLPLPPTEQQEESSGAAPDDESCWVPGNWLYENGAYRWRAGYWTQAEPDRIWIPEHYLVTAQGAILAPGYWDYRLEERGLLFAPMRIADRAAGDLQIMPSQVVNTSNLVLHLFVRPGQPSYYFGDYYADAYVKAGFRPWYDYRKQGFDPLFGYYLWHEQREGIDFLERLTGWHAYFHAHADRRPPHTVAALADFATRQAGVAESTVAILGRSLDDVAAASAHTAMPLIRLTNDQVSAVMRTTASLQGIANQRLQLEAAGEAVGDITGRALSLPRIANPIVTPDVGIPGTGVNIGAGVQETVRGTLGNGVLGGQGVLGIGGDANVEEYGGGGGGILGSGLLGGQGGRR